MADPTMSYVLCIDNQGYPASLEPRKVYQVLKDTVAEGRGLIRVIDESGEDYLYPARYFVPIEVPQAAEQAFSDAG
jgi:hypothetical protein